MIRFCRRILGALDQAAVLLARDHDLPIHIFDFDEPGAMEQLCHGEHVGTRIGHLTDTFY